MAHPIAAPAITMKKHSSMRNLFAVKDQIPAMVANISANPKYREFSSVYLHGSVLVSAYPKKISLKNFFMIAFVSSQTVYI